MIQRPCEQCNSAFTPARTNPKQRFCSVRCRNIAALSHRPRVKGRPCQQCGKIRYNCADPVCNRCKGWTVEQVAYLSSHYAIDGAQSVADALGFPLKVVRNRANKMGLRLTKAATRRVVHSQAKAYMLKHNPMKQPETVQKIRDWHTNNPEQSSAMHSKLLEGQQRLQRDKPSKLEMRLRAILDSLSIAYEPSALIKPKFVVDIRIGTLIIQADGEYWHGHPRYHPLTERQQRQRARDVAQDAYLHACGYTVIRIWDRDVTPEHIATILRQHHLL